MKDVIVIIGNKKYYTGEYIKKLVINYMEQTNYEAENEIATFYHNYIEGRMYYPISSVALYRLDWCGNEIIVTSKSEEKV